MIGTVQDVTEGKKAEREHRIAETLQRSLLPERLPEIPGVLLAARYLPATSDLEVGGDWYDVVQLPNGSMGLAIGDVAGHGLRAASTMGQLRMALRAYALEEGSPSQVLGRVRRLVRVLVPDIVTLIYLVFDPESGTLRFANAGHPPPLLVEGNGQTSYLEGGLGPPLGATAHPRPDVDATAHLDADSTLLLFTDGLVERRGSSILDGLTRLKTLAADPGEDLEVLCDHLLDSMVTDEVSDDIALLALRQVPLAAGPIVPSPPRGTAGPRPAAPDGSPVAPRDRCRSPDRGRRPRGLRGSVRERDPARIRCEGWPVRGEPRRVRWSGRDHHPRPWELEAFVRFGKGRTTRRARPAFDARAHGFRGRGDRAGGDGRPDAPQPSGGSRS